VIARSVERRASSRRTAFVNARLLDPACGLDAPGGLVVEGGRIVQVRPGDSAGAFADAEIIDCGGHLLAPGLVDTQVFSGEPGFEHRETLGSASRAAAAGGVTTLVCRPDTDPVIDDAALVDYFARRARDTAIVNAYPMAALTHGLRGEQMTEIGLLAEAGAVAFTDGASPVASARVMRRALTYARNFDALVVARPMDLDLAAGGVMNEGEISARLGLPGAPVAAETIMVERDMRLAELTGARYHAAQISAGASLEVIRRAKANGLAVTAGVSINNLVLNENDIGPYRTFFKLRPPLRSEDDRRAMVDGIASGAIDVIVSDHDPQDADTKRHPFIEAAFGAVGLETLLPAALSLHLNEEIGLLPLFAAMTCNPARIFGLDGGTIAEGAPADLVLVDLKTPWVVELDGLTSKCKNTPFEARTLQGRALMTMVGGRTVFTRKGW
jgi:dihydroorotase